MTQELPGVQPPVAQAAAAALRLAAKLFHACICLRTSLESQSDISILTMQTRRALAEARHVGAGSTYAWDGRRTAWNAQRATRLSEPETPEGALRPPMPAAPCMAPFVAPTRLASSHQDPVLCSVQPKMFRRLHWEVRSSNLKVEQSSVSAASLSHAPILQGLFLTRRKEEQLKE